MTDGVSHTGFAAAILAKRVTGEQWTEDNVQVTYLQPDLLFLYQLADHPLQIHTS